MYTANRKSDFVTVNGVRLHYLDWGGSGPTLIFLAGMGSSAYIFSEFAPRFADKFRVLALTRRGHGDSDYPDTGYDADTLVEDIRQFMAAVGVEHATFAGHSLAGVELTHIAATHPERVEKLIYLDALDDRRGEPAIMAQDPLNAVPIQRVDSAPPRTFEEYLANIKREVPAFAAIWGDVWEEEFSHGVVVNDEGIYVDRMPAHVEQAIIKNLIQDYAPKPVTAAIPALCFYGRRQRIMTDEYTAEQQAAYAVFVREIKDPFLDTLITDFQSRFPLAKVIVIPNGHHYCFIAHAELVEAEMRKFLLE